MPKEIKGNASRKPPEPAADHSDVEGWFGRQMPHLQPIVRALDESIRATIPGLQYAVKWKRPYYSPPPLGTTDRTRYIKVTTPEETRRPQLGAWIEEAGRTPGWRSRR